MLYEKTSNCMRKTIFFLMLVSISISAISQSKTIVLFEKETYYPDQVWFASHVQKDIEDSIQFYWNHGYRITDASYNSCIAVKGHSECGLGTLCDSECFPPFYIIVSTASTLLHILSIITLPGFLLIALILNSAYKKK